MQSLDFHNKVMRIFGPGRGVLQTKANLKRFRDAKLQILPMCESIFEDGWTAGGVRSDWARLRQKVSPFLFRSSLKQQKIDFPLTSPPDLSKDLAHDNPPSWAFFIICSIKKTIDKPIKKLSPHAGINTSTHSST